MQQKFHGIFESLKVVFIIHHSQDLIKHHIYFNKDGVCLLARRRMSDRSATLNQLLEKSARRNAENTDRTNDGIIHNIHHTIAGRRRFYKTVDIVRHDNDYVRKKS